MHLIRIDRAKRLAHEPGRGHNRYHPDIAPIVVGLPQRRPQDDGNTAGARLQPPAGLCYLLGRRRFAHLQCRRRAELCRLGTTAGGDLRMK